VQDGGKSTDKHVTNPVAVETGEQPFSIEHGHERLLVANQGTGGTEPEIELEESRIGGETLRGRPAEPLDDQGAIMRVLITLRGERPLHRFIVDARPSSHT
jgi:hypothetical protein